MEAGKWCLRLQPKSEVPLFAFESHIRVFHYFLHHPNHLHNNYKTQKRKKEKKEEKKR